jgi:hypothetical protein
MTTTMIVQTEITTLAHDAGLHPELVRRFVALGLIEPGDHSPDAVARLARAMRLRRDLGLNYAGAVLASELLTRIEQLEARLRQYER